MPKSDSESEDDALEDDHIFQSVDDTESVTEQSDDTVNESADLEKDSAEIAESDLDKDKE